jgi:hypothetical protein
MTEQEILDNPGLVRSGDAVVSKDAKALQAYKRQKNFYRRVDMLENKVEKLEGIIAELLERLNNGAAD